MLNLCTFTRLFFSLSVSFASLNAFAQTNVSPMLSSAWNQNSPFSDKCPLNRSGAYTKPGCGAIALGQIWNYYRLTNHGYGVAEYTSKGVASVEQDKDYDISTDYSLYSFDWANIVDTYSTSTSKKQQEAVAEYIYLIGNAIHMNYRTDGSSPSNDGQTLWGMHHHLGANPEALWHYRRYFSTEEWNDKLVRNLREGHPVYYASVWYGASAKSDFASAGHIYVIDGVNDEGLYHFNFGTASPSQNKFTSLDYISQTNGETYPGNRDVCYNYRQVMFENLFPVKDGKYGEQAIVGNKPLILNGNPKLTDLTMSKSEKFSINTSILNYSIKRDTLYVAFWATQNGEMIAPLTSQKEVRLGPGYYLEDVKFECALPETLKDGDYVVKLYSKNKNKSEAQWQEALECVPFSFNMTAKKSKTSVHFPINRMADPVIVLDEPIQEIENKHEKNYPGKVLRLKLSNPSEYNFEDTIRVTFHTSNGDKVKMHPVAVYEGCSVEYRLLIPQSFIDLSNGNYSFEIDYHKYYEDKWYKIMSKEEYITGIKPSEQYETKSAETKGGVYDLNGRSMDALQHKQIYIKNGKKYIDK